MPHSPLTHPLALQRLSDAYPPGGQIDVLAAAIAIATHHHPTLQPPLIRAALDRFARDVKHMLDHHCVPHAALRHVLFDRHGFRGRPSPHPDPLDSCLDTVLEKRRGLPILLSLVAIETARRAGLTAHGIGLPGHFIAALDPDANLTDRLYFDPFHAGRLLTREDCYRIALQHGVPWNDAFLTPIAPLHFVLRILTNLRNAYTQHNDPANTAAILEQILLITPPNPANTTIQEELHSLYHQLDRHIAGNN